MHRILFLNLALLLAIGSNARAKGDFTEGNYILYLALNASTENEFVLIKAEHRSGQDVFEILDGPKGLSLEKLHVDGKEVNIAFDYSGRKYSFDGTLSAQAPTIVSGAFGDDSQLMRGKLAPTDKRKLEKPSSTKTTDLPEPMAEAQKLKDRIDALCLKRRRTKDKEERSKLLEMIEQAEKEADERLPALYKEVLKKHAESPALVDAAMGVFAMAEKSTTSDDAALWIKALMAFGKPYGPRYQLELLRQSAVALDSQKGFEALTLDLAERIANQITVSTSTEMQFNALTILHSAQEKAGNADLARQTAARLAKLDAELDRQFLARKCPFKPKPFAGRKGKSDKVVVCELFTGAQCGPCVAADVAFDELLKVYQAKEVVLLQYHMHIPVSDPLTSPDSEARWKYYQTLDGTPSTLFNGKLRPKTGGYMSHAEARFQDFRGVIDPLLEEMTPIKLQGGVTTEGDKISVKVQVSGVQEGNDKLKLRFVLVEEMVKYVGFNGRRFHHHVVRALPGGADGYSLTDKTESAGAEVDLAELRKNLARYLDEQAKDSPFPGNGRPLELKNLLVVALVQDDSTKEIRQAVQFDVPERK